MPEKYIVTNPSWKLTRDPLYRGDSASELSLPTPSANRSIVRHILYLEGYGRETPYLSTSEALAAAQRFAGSQGMVYIAYPKAWPPFSVKHRPKKELLLLLKGKGKGDAEWPSAYEVMRARQYVEEAQEHLADFTDAHEVSTQDLREIVNGLFKSK